MAGLSALRPRNVASYSNAWAMRGLCNIRRSGPFFPCSFPGSCKQAYFWHLDELCT